VQENVSESEREREIEREIERESILRPVFHNGGSRA